MNMISTGAFLNEMDASNKQPSTAEKFAAVWEKKNAKAARAGGVSLMALSLAACGSSSTTTTTSTDTSTTTTTTVTPVSSSLTIGSDSVSGTSGDDTFSGARIDSLQTWNSNDTISGGDGTDSLTAVITAAVTPASGAVTGVENITITNAHTGGVTVTFSTATANLISGVTEVTNLASSNGLTLTRLADLADISINNTAAATTVTYADSLLTGSADAVTLKVNGATGTVNIGNSSQGGAGIETLNIVASGAASSFSSVNLDAAATSVTVTGAGNVSLDDGTNDTAAFASVGTFDASAATGNVQVTFLADGVTGTTNTKTISTGSGDDGINIANIDPATVGAVSVDAGAGNDTVVIGARGAADYTIAGGAGTGDIISVGAAASATLHSGISGFEKLYVTAGQAQDLLLYTGNNDFSTLRSAAASVDFSNVSAGAKTLELTSAATTLASVARSVDGSADALTVKSVTAAGVTTVTLTVDDAETLTFDTNTGAYTINTAFNAEDATSITVVGDNAVDLGVYAATTATLATFDASGMSGSAAASLNAGASTVAMTVTGNAATTYTGALTVTTGNGNDTITGGNGGDTLTGGAGNDTISAGAGADTITGGTGSDTITSGAGADILVFGKTDSGVDTVTDFTVNSTNSSDDRIKVDIIANDTTNATTTAATVDADAANVLEVASGGQLIGDNDVVVITTNTFVDVSGNAAADLAAIQAAAGGLTMAASDEGLAIFKADTDGDGTADEVQLWYLATDSAADTDLDTVTQLAVLQGISITSDLASDFAAGDFDL